ncbi:hypothetical protein [Adlercreutzia mucosicola]|uniref:hypothetical protein n=1 Tax=Adlercreutzia mucosicola TaxID=580026 RepID=UPI001365369F|nr:hypothetical protein [Adlercreutzia mucosicola]
MQHLACDAASPDAAVGALREVFRAAVPVAFFVKEWAVRLPFCTMVGTSVINP